MLNYININIAKFLIIHIAVKKIYWKSCWKIWKKSLKIVDLYWTFEIRYCSNHKIKIDMWIQSMT
jgi:hypothetical protein